MSGQLFGELGAARAGSLARLTQSETLALAAIINRCKPQGRTASVSLSQIRDWIGFVDEHRPGVRCSESTAKRALKALTEYGLIEVVQRGHKPRGKPAVAPVYRVADELKLGSPRMTQATPDARVTLDDPSYGGSSGHEAGKLGSQGPEARVTVPPLARGDSAVNVRTFNEEIPPELTLRGENDPRVFEAFDPDHWTVEPPKGCDAHPHNTAESCIPCKFARQRNELWWREAAAWFEYIDSLDEKQPQPQIPRVSYPTHHKPVLLAALALGGKNLTAVALAAEAGVGYGDALSAMRCFEGRGMAVVSQKPAPGRYTAWSLTGDWRVD
ncbi:hypothetical protein A5661_15785 [Mycobacterium asiaticum]|nr:hypothetical protein A5661_15785 [Mycobacterium asiaticum]